MNSDFENFEDDDIIAAILALIQKKSNLNEGDGAKLNMFNLALVCSSRKVWHTDQFPVPVDWYQKLASVSSLLGIVRETHSV